MKSGGLWRFVISGSFISGLNFFYSLLILKFESLIIYTTFTLFLVINGFYLNLCNSIQASISIKHIEQKKTLWLFILHLTVLSFFLSCISIAMDLDTSKTLVAITIFLNCTRLAIKSTIYTYGEFHVAEAAELIYIVSQLLVFCILLFLNFTLFDSVLLSVLLSSVFSMIYSWSCCLRFIQFTLRFRRYSITFKRLVQPSFYALITEVMSNSVPYYVAFVHGAAAYTSIALAGIFFRPASLVISQLNQYVRIKIKKINSEIEKNTLHKKAFIANTMFLIFGVAVFCAYSFFQNENDIDLVISFLLTLLIMIVRVARQALTVEFTHLQGFFKTNKVILASILCGLPFLFLSCIRVEYALLSTFVIEIVFLSIMLFKANLR